MKDAFAKNFQKLILKERGESDGRLEAATGGKISEGEKLDFSDIARLARGEKLEATSAGGAPPIPRAMLQMRDEFQAQLQAAKQQQKTPRRRHGDVERARTETTAQCWIS